MRIFIRLLLFVTVSSLPLRLCAQYSERQRFMTDSLEQVLLTEQLSAEQLFNIYADLNLWYGSGKVQKSAEYAQKGLDLALQIKDDYWIAFFYNRLSDAVYYTGNFDSSLFLYQKAIDLLEPVQKKITQQKIQSVSDLKAEIYTSIATIYNYFGKTDEALSYYFKALTILEQSGNEKEVVKLYTYLAHAYKKSQNWEQVFAYYDQAERLAKKLGDSLYAGIAMGGLADIHFIHRNYAEALKNAEAAYRLLSACDDATYVKIIPVLHTLANILTIKQFQPDYDKALQYAEKALQYAKEWNNPNAIASSLFILSDIYYSQKKYVESEATAFRALEADSTNLYVNSILYETITQCNIRLGNQGKAIRYLSKTLSANRIYSNKNFQASLSEMEVKYETEKKEVKISNLEKEKQFYTILGVILIITLLLVTGLFVYRHKLHKNKIVRLQQEQQLAATQAVLDSEVQERSRIARDLHDGLGSILAAAKYNLADIKKSAVQEIDAERFDKALNLLDDSMHEMRRVAHHLMPESLSTLGLKQSAADFCNGIPHVKFNWYGEETRFDPKMEVMLYRIMHELVSNALKHSGASHILVEIVRYADRVILAVQDDGCGFDPSAEVKGMGLSNIRARVAAYNGNVLVDSKTGVGTEVNVELIIDN
ncbi:MAG: sensor histidine kinase [Bacteroidales bacterium]|nr:sensor histidine kinase [Bacteroidales bacterium]